MFYSLLDELEDILIELSLLKEQKELYIDPIKHIREAGL